MNNDLINREALLIDLSQDREDGTFEFSEEQAEAADKILRYVYSRIIAQPAVPGLPRVLTLDEALEADVCWLEKKWDDRVWPCKVGGGEKWAAIWRFDQEPMAVPRDEYGKLFRCWSARTTKEQRKAASWPC